MLNLIMGFVIGFVVATIGVGGVVSFLDNNLENAKETIEKIN